MTRDVLSPPDGIVRPGSPVVRVRPTSLRRHIRPAPACLFRTLFAGTEHELKGELMKHTTRCITVLIALVAMSTPAKLVAETPAAESRAAKGRG